VQVLPGTASHQAIFAPSCNGSGGRLALGQRLSLPVIAAVFFPWLDRLWQEQGLFRFCQAAAGEVKVICGGRLARRKL
jgi:hypothetical protein